MSTIINNQYIPTHLSEMPNVSKVRDTDRFPIIQQGYNKNATLSVIKSSLAIPTLSDSLDLERSDVASSALAANLLANRIKSLRSELNSLIDDLNSLGQSTDDKFENLEVDWSQITNIPEIIGKVGPQGIQGIQGIQGNPGDDGKDGKDGEDGKDGQDGKDGIDGQPGENGTYVHIRYSKNANGKPMSTTPNKYVGILVSKNRTASTNAEDYTWSLLEGQDGKPGLDGQDGEDGKTHYWHVRYGIGYGEDGVMQFTPNNGKDIGDWMGQYVDQNEEASLDPRKYSWSYVKGTQGDAGPEGPISLFMGVYNDTEYYVGTDKVRHIVQWFDGEDEHYYITRYGVGSFRGIKPSNTLYWDSFDFNYKSIATEFLFAEGANIAGWQFYTADNGDMILKSQTNGTILNGTTGEISAINGGFLVNKNGTGSFAKGNAKWKDDGSLVLLGRKENSGSYIHIGDEEHPGSPYAWSYGRLDKDKLKFVKESSTAGGDEYSEIGVSGIKYKAPGIVGGFETRLGTEGVSMNGSSVLHTVIIADGIPDKRKHQIVLGSGWGSFAHNALYIDENGELQINN